MRSCARSFMPFLGLICEKKEEKTADTGVYGEEWYE